MFKAMMIVELSINKLYKTRYLTPSSDVSMNLLSAPIAKNSRIIPANTAIAIEKAFSYSLLVSISIFNSTNTLNTHGKPVQNPILHIAV